jgi:carbon monoxide dehydrogenase subunit G
MSFLSGRVVVSISIDAPAEQVWAAAADFGSHVDWMADAESIAFETESRSGLGTRMRVATKVGPFRTDDLMEVTRWEEGRTIGVRHSGLVTGEGRFVLSPMADGTRFTWTEDLTFPWWLGGPVTATLARPILGWVWRRNLTGLKRLLESDQPPVK